MYDIFCYPEFDKISGSFFPKLQEFVDCSNDSWKVKVVKDAGSIMILHN